jgi:hypothetical protein
MPAFILMRAYPQRWILKRRSSELWSLVIRAKRFKVLEEPAAFILLYHAYNLFRVCTRISNLNTLQKFWKDNYNRIKAINLMILQYVLSYYKGNFSAKMETPISTHAYHLLVPSFVTLRNF